MDLKAQTPKQRLVEQALGGTSVADWVDAMRAEGNASTWAALAEELTNATGEPVSHESLRSWYLRATEEAMPT